MADYISRDDVIKKIAEVQDKATSGTEDVTYYRAIKIIRDMPAADVQPVKHGRWIDRTEWFGRIGKCQYECSVCGYMREGKPQSRYDGKGGKFCDECGARMDGEQNDT